MNTGPITPKVKHPHHAQGPARNDELTDQRYRNGPYPGDIPEKPAGDQASTDAVVPRPANDEHSTSADLDHERAGGMSGGLASSKKEDARKPSAPTSTKKG